MQSKKLSQKIVDELTPREKRYKQYDDNVKGLFVRVSPSGLKVYYIFLRVNGRGTDFKLGPCSEMTLKAARLKAIEALSSARDGTSPADTRRTQRSNTLEGFIEISYKNYISSVHKDPSTTLWTLSHCFSVFSKTPLSDITVQKLDSWRSSQSLAPATLNRRTATLRAALSKATEWGITTHNPLASLKLLKVPKVPVEFLTKDQIVELRTVLAKRDEKKIKQREAFNKWRAARNKEPFPDYDHLEVSFADYLTPLVNLILSTGLRFGEAINLQWSDINEEGTLTAKSPKTSSFRYIPLLLDVQSDLKRLKRLNKANTGFNDHKSLNEDRTDYISDNVFVNPETNRPLKSVKTAWNGVRSKLSFECDFRMLRRTFGSRLIANGTPVYHVSQLLGHSNIETTQRWYLSLNLDAYRSAVASIDELNF